MNIPKFLKRSQKFDSNLSFLIDVLTIKNEKIIEKLQEIIDLLKSEVDK